MFTLGGASIKDATAQTRQIKGKQRAVGLSGTLNANTRQAPAFARANASSSSTSSRSSKSTRSTLPILPSSSSSSSSSSGSSTPSSSTESLPLPPPAYVGGPGAMCRCQGGIDIRCIICISLDNFQRGYQKGLQEAREQARREARARYRKMSKKPSLDCVVESESESDEDA